MKKSLTAQSVKVLNILEHTMFENPVLCNDIEHVEFMIKSEYNLGQISTNLIFVKKDNCYFAVNDGSILFEMMFRTEDEKFKVYKITDAAFNKVEALF